MINANLPLASRIRPKKIDDFYGQEEIIGKGKLLRNAIQVDKLPSMIFWGPPGSGKTTLASIIAEQTKSQFEEISAVSSGLKDLRDIILKAKENIKINKKTILFIDEIHRWNKKQQDGLLPYVERGIVTLIGATTENPSFEVRSALLSRCRVFVLKCLSKDSIIKIINRALLDKENGLGNLNLKISQETISVLAQMSNGDARSALSALEYASEVNTDINTELIKEAFQKSNVLYAAYNKIKVDIEKYGNLPVPMHIRNAPTNLMRDLVYGGGYKYSPDYGYTEKQDYLPEELKNRKYLK